MIGPIISGLMSDRAGWRSFWWFNVGLVGLSLLMVIFMFPETQYHRPHPDEIDAATAQTGTSSPASNEKTHIGLAENEKLSHSVTRNTMPDLSLTETAARDPHLGKGYPSKRQWKLYQVCENPMKSIAVDLWTPVRMFAFPIVEFAAFVVSWSCGSFLTLNLTQAQVFANPPYNLSSETIGFFNFAILIGAFIGLATSGPLSDWVAARATKRNGGIREPEMRLAAMIPYVIIM